jgi:hypothetical protein
MRHFLSVFLVVVIIGVVLASEKQSAKRVSPITSFTAPKTEFEAPNQPPVAGRSKAMLQMDSEDLQSHLNDAATDSQGEECNVFGGMAASLLAEISHVPPRLPGFIPGCGGKKKPHAGLVVAVRSRYEIELEWDKDCHGAMTCYYGTIQASSTPPVSELGNGVRVPVTLKGGIKGSFVPPDCVSDTCGSSSIVWTEGGYYYSIGLVGEKKEILIEVANSSIDDVFGDVRPVLQQKTRVPLRLPSYISSSGDKEVTLYAILEVAELSRYEIQLAWDKNCLGGNACHEGTIGGSTDPLVEQNRPKVPVTLKGGIRGYFIDTECGAHCGDSSISWKQGRYYYSIGIKAERKTTLIKMANSAIADAREQNR